VPQELEELKIVQISDLHIGSTIKRSYVDKVVAQVNDLNPDIVFFTGDAVDGSVDYLQHDAEPLSKIEAPLGKYFVTGNHEYYSGVKMWTTEMERLGYTVLTNDHKLISYQDVNILLVGIPDHEALRMDPENAPDLATALAGAPQHDYSILLAHQPVAIKAAAEYKINLQFSGHTHGGQYVPWNYVVDLVQPYTAGLHKHGPTWIYVNRGTGYWGPPVRIGVPSEITVIRLIASKNSHE
jgi:predicted MPP superfamily phosphohydrolase